MCGLSSLHETDIGTKLMYLIESKPYITINSLTTECTRLLNMEDYTSMVGAAITKVQKGLFKNLTSELKSILSV